MSRATRPLRRVRGAERDRLRAVFPHVALWWVFSAARRLGCRPAHLRRCLLGLPVSARAAGRILAAASGRAWR